MTFPESLLNKASLFLAICHASVYRLFIHDGSLAKIFALSHEMLWPSFVACSAKADDCVFANLTFAICSLVLVPNERPVSPMYTASHSPHGI